MLGRWAADVFNLLLSAPVGQSRINTCGGPGALTKMRPPLNYKTYKERYFLLQIEIMALMFQFKAKGINFQIGVCINRISRSFRGRRGFSQIRRQMISKKCCNLRKLHILCLHFGFLLSLLGTTCKSFFRTHYGTENLSKQLICCSP